MIAFDVPEYLGGQILMQCDTFRFNAVQSVIPNGSPAPLWLLPVTITTGSVGE